MSRSKSMFARRHRYGHLGRSRPLPDGLLPREVGQEAIQGCHAVPPDGRGHVDVANALPGGDAVWRIADDLAKLREATQGAAEPLEFVL